jgi:rubredoxin
VKCHPKQSTATVEILFSGFLTLTDLVESSLVSFLNFNQPIMLEFDRTDVSKSSADINEAVDFSFVPVNCQCPHCKINVVTFTDTESGWQSYLGCCVSLFF